MSANPRTDPGAVLTATLREPTEGEATRRRIGAVSLHYTCGELATRAIIEPRSGITRLLGGRRPPADLVIDDPSVSAAHFELELTEDRVILRDLGSTNGTWIYGVRVREVELAYGARFAAGAVVVVLERVQQVDVAIATQHRFDALLGKSLPMQELYAVLKRLALAQLDVLVTGETGTGKELVARALHRHSRRAAGPFIVLDCSTLPRDLAEAAILGHAAGAFTGATRARPGALEDAHGGTIFFDEIGELPLELQAKLLRVLAERSVTRIGETATRPVDVRVVAATHRNLPMMVLDRRFREDLYYRLAQYTVELPALRERGVDIELLARAFLAEYSVGFEGRRDYAPDALASLRAHGWPGNVRELRNLVMRAAQMTTTAVIECSDLALAAAELGHIDDARVHGTPAMPVPMELARYAGHLTVRLEDARGAEGFEIHAGCPCSAQEFFAAFDVAVSTRVGEWVRIRDEKLAAATAEPSQSPAQPVPRPPARYKMRFFGILGVIAMAAGAGAVVGGAVMWKRGIDAGEPPSRQGLGAAGVVAVTGGILIAGWTLRRQLGKGGMGQVWKVDRPTAAGPAELAVMKLPLSNGIEDASTLRRAGLEAKAMYLLQGCPNVLQIKDMGVYRDVPFMQTSSDDPVAAS